MAASMRAADVASLAQIGFATALGDGYSRPCARMPGRCPVVAEARYNPGDASVTAQVLRLLSARPGAVFVAASGVPATTPIIELRARGFAGPVYTVMGIAGAAALRVGGKALDGVRLSGVPVLAAEQLADANPVKAPALAFIRPTRARYGAGSRSLFGATLWDSFLLVEAGATVALGSQRPGTAGVPHRAARRDGARGRAGGGGRRIHADAHGPQRCGPGEPGDAGDTRRRLSPAAAVSTPVFAAGVDSIGALP